MGYIVDILSAVKWMALGFVYDAFDGWMGFGLFLIAAGIVTRLLLHQTGVV